MLKELKGSEKQIAWAEDIRRKIMEGLNTLSSKGFNINKYIEKVNEIEESKWFIDNRENYSSVLPRVICDRNGKFEGQIIRFTELVGGVGAVVYREDKGRPTQIIISKGLLEVIEQ